MDRSLSLSCLSISIAFALACVPSTLAEETLTEPTIPQIASEAAPVTLPFEATAAAPLDLEAHPLPRTTTTPGATPGIQSGTSAWWNGPEARVVGCLLLLLGGSVLFAKYGPKSLRGAALTGGTRPSGVVQVLSRFPVGRGRQLLLLECGPRILLLEETKSRSGSGGLQTLTEFTSPEDVAALRARIEAASRPSEESFRRDLERSLESYSRTGAPVNFGGGGMPPPDSFETVDLTRRRPRRASRGLE